MICQTEQLALPSRYAWNSAVGSTIDAKAADPSGLLSPAQRKYRPAIGFVAGVAGSLVYQDTQGNVCFIAQCNAGQYYPADLAKVLASGTVTQTDGTTAAVTSTVYKLTMFWPL